VKISAGGKGMGKLGFVFKIIGVSMGVIGFFLVLSQCQKLISWKKDLKSLMF
jgi:hypothetical protein